jgi:hypothetical protein
VLVVNEEIVLHESIGMKGRHNGEKKPFIEQLGGADLCRKTGEWMEKSRVIDRDNDKYTEIVKDPKTGEVVYQCEEPLSKHVNHGSAKKANISVNQTPQQP